MPIQTSFYILKMDINTHFSHLIFPSLLPPYLPTTRSRLFTCPPTYLSVTLPSYHLFSFMPSSYKSSPTYLILSNPPPHFFTFHSFIYPFPLFPHFNPYILHPLPLSIMGFPLTTTSPYLLFSLKLSPLHVFQPCNTLPGDVFTPP